MRTSAIENATVVVGVVGGEYADEIWSAPHDVLESGHDRDYR